MSRSRWYGSTVSKPHGEKRAPIQIHRWRRDEYPTLPDELVRLASDEYNRQGFGQTHERLCERGGLSDIEIICLLADALEHERQRPHNGRTESGGDNAR
jgi:hypothetical protein